MAEGFPVLAKTPGEQLGRTIPAYCEVGTCGAAGTAGAAPPPAFGVAGAAPPAAGAAGAAPPGCAWPPKAGAFGGAGIALPVVGAVTARRRAAGRPGRRGDRRLGGLDVFEDRGGLLAEAAEHAQNDRRREKGGRSDCRRARKHVALAARGEEVSRPADAQRAAFGALHQDERDQRDDHHEVNDDNDSFH